MFVSCRSENLAVAELALGDWTFAHAPQFDANGAAYDREVAEAALTGDINARRIVERAGDTP